MEMTDYRKLFELDGKVALVTGAAGGIGSEACRALASAGAAVLVTDSSEEKGRVIAEEIRSSGARAEFFKLDVTNDQAWQNAIAGADTRSLAHYLGHRNLQSTARYTALAPDRFAKFWKD
jgi:NAD(P)-dependent dehydrogenase (short-subunit alcohol dehydrogenase family)